MKCSRRNPALGGEVRGNFLPVETRAAPYVPLVGLSGLQSRRGLLAHDCHLLTASFLPERFTNIWFQRAQHGKVAR